MAQGEFLWCDLATFEVDDMLPIYGKLFDWSYRSEKFAGNAIYHYASNDHDVSAGIYEMPKEIRGEGMKSFWMSYVGVDDIVEGIDITVAEGGRVVLGPATFGAGASIAMVADPDGAILTLFSGSSLLHRPQTMRHGTHFWNELFSRDVERACNFYSQLLNWRMEPGDADGVFHVRNMAGAATTRIQPILPDTPSGATPHWAVSFAVDSIDVIEARCSDMNLTVARAPGLGGAERLCVTDSNGASCYAVPVDPRRYTWFT